MRSKSKHLILFCALSSILFGQIILAQVPQTISFQGVLTDVNGATVPDGNYNLTFKLYESATAGPEVWSETQSVAVSRGVYNTILGTIVNLGLIFTKQYWLGVTIESGTELTPRIQLTSSPYSFMTAAIPDGIVSTNKIADNAVTGNKISTGQVVKSINSLKDDVTIAAGSNVGITSSGNTIYISSSGGTGGGDITSVIAGTGLSGGGTSGDVTLNVEVPLDLTGNVPNPSSVIIADNSGTGEGITGASVDGNGIGGYSTNKPGVYGSSTNNYGTFGKHFMSDNFGYLGSPSYGAYGKHNTSGNFGWLGSSLYGVYGSGKGVGKIGVYGEHETMGHFGYLGSSDYGAYGKHFTSGNYGYLGSNSEGVFGASPTQYGVWGESNTGQGVHGKSTDSYGIFGESTNFVGVFGRSLGTEWPGVSGSNSDGSRGGYLGSAVYGITCWNDNLNGIALYANGQLGFAAYLQGNVSVTGTLSKGGGSFKIDHPLDPANKYLYHSFVESPDMMNVYNGNITLNTNGEAIVELPEWFEALNRDFRYQLTCIGGFASVYIAQEVSGNSFKIAGGTPGLKVSWQVTGIRHDKFAEAHRIPVEENKSGKEIGKYLHPIENGVPESYGINYEEDQKLIQQQKKMKEELEKLDAKREKSSNLRNEN